MSSAVINLSKNVNLSAQDIMTGRGCIIGQSGSGKSYLVGVLLEELCKLKFSFCVVDPEGEYYPLRSAFQVIIVGGNKGDLGLEIDFHALFKSSIQNNLPVILDLSESMQKDEVLNKALSELYLVEEELEMPYLVVVEEADKFAPQTHRTAGIIEELAVRGRKRGIGLLVVSQRPANVSKNVLSQCGYGFIGKLTVENDMNAVSIFFSRAALRRIATHNPGEFSSFGLGISSAVQVKRMLTEHAGATPSLKPTVAGEKLVNVISELKQETGNVTLVGTNTKQKLINAYSLQSKIDEEYIRRYAFSNEKKEFVLFGKKIESIDGVNKKFISVVLAGVRLPSKHKNEYTEGYLILDDKSRFVLLDDKLSFFQGPIIGESKLLPEDYDVLSSLSKSHKKDVDDISRELGMGTRAVHNSISRLKLRKLAVSKGKEASLISYNKYLMQDKPITVAVDADPSSILNTRVDERIEKDWIKAIFPSSVLFECKRVLIPAYEVRLRHGNKVRVLLLEAVHGQVIKE